MGQAERDGEHIWLRQSVTFTANGQTRTVEMAIPLHLGASAEDVERLLAEAEAGMQRLSARLDGQVSALLNGAGSQAAALDVAAPAKAPPVPASASIPAPAPPTEAPRPASPPAPTRPAAVPTRAAAPTPTPTTATPATRSAPTPPTPPTSPAPAARARPNGTKAAPATPNTAELTRKDFLAATTELGLNVKQVMERLHVRTLEGLNLREALEALHRQLLRDGEGTPDTAPAAPIAPAAPQYFEEEDDDYEVTFTMDGEDALAEEFGAYGTDGQPASAVSGGANNDTVEPDELDEFDLDDVPDFGPPASAPARRNPAARPAPAEERDSAPLASPAGERISQLRAIRGGGALTPYQRTAYRNVVLNELGEPEAVALIRGLWRVSPDRLGADQLDALVSWGKQDTFAEEASAVIAALRAERQQAAAAATADAPPSSAAAPRATPRSRPAQEPHAPPGGR
ncbi:MAG: hypothetical protein ACRDHP_03995 [Ktedonobacterales bacterium]